MLMNEKKCRFIQHVHLLQQVIINSSTFYCPLKYHALVPEQGIYRYSILRRTILAVPKILGKLNAYSETFRKKERKN